MGAFWGALLGAGLIAVVVGYWLRRIARMIAVIGAVFEATANRAARNRGEAPVSDDIDPRTFLGD